MNSSGRTIYLQINDYENAKRVLNEKLADSPKNIKIFIQLAKLHLKLNDLETAYNYFVKIIHHELEYYILGETNLDHFYEAIDIIINEYALKSNSLEAQTLAAQAMLEIGNEQIAFQLLEMAINNENFQNKYAFKENQKAAYRNYIHLLGKQDVKVLFEFIKQRSPLAREILEHESKQKNVGPVLLFALSKLLHEEDSLKNNEKVVYLIFNAISLEYKPAIEFAENELLNTDTNLSSSMGILNTLGNYYLKQISRNISLFGEINWEKAIYYSELLAKKKELYLLNSVKTQAEVFQKPIYVRLSIADIFFQLKDYKSTAEVVFNHYKNKQSNPSNGYDDDIWDLFCNKDVRNFIPSAIICNFLAANSNLEKLAQNTKLFRNLVIEELSKNEAMDGRLMAALMRHQLNFKHNALTKNEIKQLYQHPIIKDFIPAEEFAKYILSCNDDRFYATKIKKFDIASRICFLHSNHKDELTSLIELALVNNNCAQILLAFYYLSENHHDEADKYFKRSAENGHPLAIVILNSHQTFKQLDSIWNVCFYAGNTQSLNQFVEKYLNQKNKSIFKIFENKNSGKIVHSLLSRLSKLQNELINPLDLIVEIEKCACEPEFSKNPNLPLLGFIAMKLAENLAFRQALKLSNHF